MAVDEEEPHSSSLLLRESTFLLGESTIVVGEDEPRPSASTKPRGVAVQR